MRYMRDHIRIVVAFLLREMATRYGNKPGGYIWSFLEPAAYIAIMSVLFGAISHVPPIGTSYILFFATGYLAFQLYRATETYVVKAVDANKNLLSYPIVSPIDPVIARFLLQAITWIVVSSIILAVCHIDVRQVTEINFVPILLSMTFAWTLALGVGLLNSAFFFHSPLYEKLYTVVTRPLMLLSGVLHLPDGLPAPYKDYLLLNPICHIVMLFRKGFYSQYRADGLDIRYLTEWSVLLLAAGTLAFTAALPYLRKR